MKQSYFGALLALVLATPVVAQNLTPYAVVAPCSPSNAPSRLKKLVGTSFVDIGAVAVEGVPVTINGLGYDSGDPSRVFGLGVNLAMPGVVPLYQISTTNGVTTNLGVVTPPPVPVANANGDGYSVVFNLIGDGSASRKYYIMGLSARVQQPSFTINDATLYVGEINLSASPVLPVPIWRAATLDAAANAVVANFLSQTTAYFFGVGPLPRGGIQDWLFDPTNGHLISYLGVEQKFLTVSNITSSPSGVVTTPSPQIPVSLEIGGLYRDKMNNVFAIASDNGTVYQIDRLTGNYTGNSFSLGGCLRGDAATAPSPITLPVELTGFTAKANRGVVDLAWKTASESNVAYFYIERQNVGESHDIWRVIDSVAAQNRPNGFAYESRDTSPSASRLRYRLATRDHDGSVSYSGAVEVRLNAGPKLEPVSPNPTADECLISLSAPLSSPGLVEVYNAMGIRVSQQPLTGSITRLTTASLPVGIYTVVATIAESRQTQRLVISR